MKIEECTEYGVRIDGEWYHKGNTIGEPLKPCPFCGSGEIKFGYVMQQMYDFRGGIASEAGKEMWYQVYCTKCHASAYQQPRIKDAFEKWNTRSDHEND